MTAPAVLLVPIDTQIAQVERELSYRLRVTPERVKAGKLTQAMADRELDTWRAVLATLKATRE